MWRFLVFFVAALAPLTALAGAAFSVSFSNASPSAAFTPEERKIVRMYVTGALPAGGATLKCSLPGANNYLPFVVENVTLYTMTTAGIWEFQTVAPGESCRLEYAGTAAGGVEFRQ